MRKYVIAFICLFAILFLPVSTFATKNEIVRTEGGEKLGSVATIQKGNTKKYELYDVLGKRLLDQAYDHAYISGEYVVLGNGIENERQDGVYDFRTQTMIAPISKGRISSIPYDDIFERVIFDVGEKPQHMFYNREGGINFSNLPDNLDIVGYLGQGFFLTSQKDTEKYGVITTEKVLLLAEYESVILGENNLILCKKDSKGKEMWGAADRKGNILLRFKFTDYDQGSGLFFNTIKGSKEFYLETGEYLFRADRINSRQGNVYYFEKGGKLGGVTKDGELAVQFYYSGIDLPGHPYRGFSILYNESPDYNPKLDNRYDFTAVNGQGEILIPKGRYAYINSFTPYTFIDCYDENMKLIAQYTREGQKIPLDSKLDFSRFSTWAEKELKVGRALGLIPYELDIAYQSPCSREEFCIYLSHTIEKISGKSLESLVAEYGELKTFHDCPRYEVSVAHTLGIVSGVSRTSFKPEAQITREQAAALLARTARFLEIQSNTGAISFKDTEEFSDYAKEDITFISSIKGKGIRVMTGVGNEKFSPRGNYTREQAILTLLRLYQSDQ